MRGGETFYWTARFGQDARTLVLAECGNWWHINWIIAGTARALATRDQPRPDSTVTDVRALDHAEYDLLLAEARARVALGGG